MIKVAICDDDVNFLRVLEDIMDRIKNVEHITLEIEVYLDGKELVQNICKNKRKFDLIFLDIEMKGMDGLTTAREIRRTDDLTMLIYVTSYKSYAIEAYEVQPFQFMVKPVDFEIVHRYFMKAYDKLLKGSYYFPCQFKGEIHILRMNDIMYFRSSKRIIQVYMADGKVYQFYGKMKELDERMKQEKTDFWRIHQSYLVNIRYISVISFDQVILKNKRALSISVDRRKAIGEKYLNYIKENIIE